MSLNIKNVSRFLTFLIFISVLGACSSNNDVVSSRKFQKRKYQKGLFVQNTSKSNNLKSVKDEQKTEPISGTILNASTKENQDNLVLKKTINLAEHALSRSTNQIRENGTSGIISTHKSHKSVKKEAENEVNPPEEPFNEREVNKQARRAFALFIIGIILLPVAVGYILFLFSAAMAIPAMDPSKDGQKDSQLGPAAFYGSLIILSLIPVLFGLVSALINGSEIFIVFGLGIGLLILLAYLLAKSLYLKKVAAIKAVREEKPTKTAD
tara:strand:+ start:332 stop:1132 length:801 start_codon:yes stop_codon:yes gene_type:complete